MSILIFHPSVAPFVQQAARALYEAGALDRFVVTVRDHPQDMSQRVICALGRLAGKDMAAQFRRRAVTEVPADKVEPHPWGELARLLTGTLDRDGRAADFVWEQAETGFDRGVARRLPSNLTGVYGFEHSALATFQRARALGMAAIYDVPAPEARFVQNLLDAETDKFPELRTPLQRHTARRDARRIARRHAEWQCANIVIAASKFTAESYVGAGLDASKVRIVPYGAPPAASREEALGPVAKAGSPATFIWAGTFSIRKGAHYLLEAWRRGGFGRQAKLKIFGAITLPPGLMQSLPAGVELGGSVSRAVLMDHYRQADALIFPTLCDGFGMVVTEAWSRGLPVITTERAGAADLLRPNQNGLLIRAGAEEPIREVLDWAVTHRAELAGMRESALATAAAWQWSDYRRGLAEALRSAKILGESGK